MNALISLNIQQVVALLAGGVDRNIINPFCPRNLRVALLAGGVDRNQQDFPQFFTAEVALLAGGVDRNILPQGPDFKGHWVALLAGGVDRNHIEGLGADYKAGSPSSRGAWIEIYKASCEKNASDVALLAGGVDRNNFAGVNNKLNEMSPSSRGAWIEIQNTFESGRPSATSPSSQGA